MWQREATVCHCSTMFKTYCVITMQLHTWMDIIIGNPEGCGSSVFVAMAAHPGWGK